MPARSPFVPFDFEQRRQQDQSIGTVHTFDPVSDVVGTMRQAEQRDSFLSGEMAPAESLRYFRSQLFGRDPEKTARATVLSRRVGEPPVMIEGREDTFDRYLRASAFQRSVATNPELSRFFGNNPRYAVAASDDAKSVGLVGQGFADIQRPKPSLWSWLNGMGVGFVGGGKQMWQGYQLYRQDNPFATPGALGLGNNPGALLPFLAPDEYRRMVRETEPGRRAIIDRYTATQSEIEAATPDFDTSTFLGKTLMGLYQGTSSLAQMAPGMAASIALRSPYPALGAAALQSGLPAYAKYRARGATVAEAQIGATIEGGAEAAGEVLPALLVARKFGKTGAGSFLTEFLVKDMLGEQATTLVQDAADTAIANPDKTWGDYLAERPDAAYQTALGVLVMSGTMGGANHVVRKFVEAGEARANAANIDRLGRAAEASELRRRDPEAYNELIRHMAEKSGTPHVFIPADAVREYMQSDSYDAFNDPFEDYRDQVDEAAETGGDVVLPAEFVLGTLPGTPAWNALKADIRLKSDGLSEREAEHFDNSMDDVESELETLAKEGSPDKTEELTQRLQEKLQDAGFTPYVARQQAALMVNRIVTRAARLGNDVTGTEGDYLDIRQVLPPELAKARAADTLDLVINALRKGGEATKQSGQSLLEFIASHGGIEDRGGDIASMGGDKWHRAAPFRKKLLKAFDTAQGSMIGGEYNPNSIGSMFDAAVSAGYFPDLLVQREEGSGYADALDANAFIDAIGEELAGNPRYAEEAQTDHFRAAADELRQALSERGLDPEGLSDDELRAIVAQMGEAQDGAGFDQLPDTLDIDGVQRPTRNSEGMPLAGSEEGVRAFWAWFGDSKVVDDQGRPLVVYHGTRSGEIEAFDPDLLGQNTGAASARLGFFFSGNEATALAYVDRTLTENDRSTSDGVVSGFDRIIADLANWADANAPEFSKALRSSNVLLWHSNDDPGVAAQANSYDPSEIDGFGGYLDDVIREVDNAAFWEADLEGGLGEYAQSQIDRLQALKDAYDNIDLNGTADEEAGSIVLRTYLKIEQPLEADQGGKAYRETSYFDLINQGKEGGSDGVIIRNTFDGGPKDDIYVAFDPTQIKSINNRGTFDPADPRILYQSAYHGSPHIFDKFSLDYMGTGEGQQAYGWGLYFAGRKEIAEHYRNTLTLDVGFDYAGKTGLNRAEVQNLVNMKYGGRYLDNVARASGVADKVMDDLIYGGKNNYKEGSERRAVYDEIAAELKRPENTGRLYQVEIPEDDEYLLWDKPLSEQPEKVKAALKDLGFDIPQRPNPRDWIVDPEVREIVRLAMKQANESRQDVEMVIDNDYDLYRRAVAYAEKRGIEDADANAGGIIVDLAGAFFDQLEGAVSLTGEMAYRGLSNQKGPDRTGDQGASVALKEAGIAGIKYLDGSSRSQGEGSYNYVLFDDSRISITAYDQAYGDGPRGRIQFIPDGRSIIELFKDRNLSTLLHELGHDYLEQLRADAGLLTAPDQLLTDWQTVQDWFKANGYDTTDGLIPTEAHELWARGFERYLMEGKAPSQGLQRIFETFRGWLTAIYKKVAALRSPITPEIREVMDRLLATDEEIAAMREQQMLEPLFKDAASIGMTDAEFQAYTDDITRSRHAASGALLEKTMAAIRARETKRYKEARAEVEREVADQVDNVPLFRAMRHMKAGKVDAVWLEREMGKDAKSLLPKGTVKEGGLHPDAIAEISGFDSGKQMIEAVMGAEAQHRQLREEGDKRSMRDRAIQTATDTEMNRRYGDPLSDGSIEREALAAVHSEKQGEVFAAEARALARKTGQRPTPYRMARDWARRKVREGVYQTEASAGAIQRHQRNVAKAGREAEKAMLAGKFEDALRFKQQQMVSSALLAEAKLANDEVEAARKRLDKIARKATSKTIDQAYLDQAHALLEQVDLRPRSQKSIDRQGKWEAWAAEREAEGFDIVVPASFEATLGQQNWSRLPVETLLALDAAVAQVVHLGRMKQRLLDGKEARDFDALVKEARDGAANINGKPPKGLDEPGFWDAIRSGAAGIDASLLKMETVFDWLDGGNSNGVFNRVVFRPIAEAQGREADMTKDYLGRIKALFEALPGETVQRWTDKVQTPFIDPFNGRPYTPTRQRLIAMALNIGNEGNMQRLADGYGWNAGAIENFLTSELTAEEWQFVQGVWDTIETLWPEIEAMERRVNGVAPDKVEAREIVTPHGTYRGGYYPAVYDSTLNLKAEARAGRESDLFESGYTRASTRSSATKARADQVRAPILLDLGVINRHLGEVIHDITHREPVMQANKFLTSERIMKLVDEALGQEIRKQFRPWLKFVANSWAMERAGNEGFGKWLGKLRANTTAVGMGLRATTMVTQIAGYSNSTEVVGEKWMAEAIARSTASPIETYRFVMERSAEVRHRMDTLDRDIRTELARLSASNPVSRVAREAVDAKRFFFHGIGYMDRVVSVPTWLAGYNKALAEGMTEEEAAYAGDKAVRVSQGAGAPKDLAAIQRGTGKWGEALKLFTMFYSYFSAQYQRERTLVRDAMGADKRRSRSVPRLAARAFWLLVVPPLMVELLKMGLGGGNPPDDEEWWSQWIARKLLSNAIGPIPLARDIFEPAWNAARGAQVYNPEFSPVNRFGTSIVNALKDAGKIARGEETKHATKDMLEAAGYATGLVPGQLASASQFLVDVGNGDADPRTFGDWMEGLTTGKIKD